MALQTNGAISIADVSVELGMAPTENTSLGDSRVKRLIKNVNPNGSISLSDLHGKSAFVYRIYSQPVFYSYWDKPVLGIDLDTVEYGIGFRVEAANRDVELTRMVGIDSLGAVIFDISIHNPNTNTGFVYWHVEQTQYYPTPLSKNPERLKNSLTCVLLREDIKIYRVVVYDSKGAMLEVDHHRMIPILGAARWSGPGGPASYIPLGMELIPENRQDEH